MSFRTSLFTTTLTIFLAACGGNVNVSTGGSGGTGGAGGNGGSTTGTTGGTTGTGGTTTTPTTGAGGACTGNEATLGNAACAPGDAICHAGTDACIALKEFAGAPVFDMRIAQLTATKPDALTAAKNPVVWGILAKGVTPYVPSCNLNGNGTISWLLSFDLTNNKLETGSAAFNADALSPYKYATGQVSGGLGVDFAMAPMTVDLSIDSSCLFQSSAGDMTLQIFLTGPQDYMLLPLSGVRVSGQVSGAHNCIGRYDVAALDPNSQCLSPKYQNGGKITGLISLLKSDQVAIPALKRTLCALLTGEDDGGVNIKACKKDAAGNITSKGDACLATGGAATADCADGLFYEADFAASGVAVAQ